MRERWGSRIGLVLAMAGNAVGLGNFLRFPVQVTSHGGGAFMIPYFVCLLLMGVPLMWIEWTIGRYGGRYGHSTTPGMFARLSSHPAAKYVGALGVLIPLLVGFYYLYVESWSLAYALFSLTGKYFRATDGQAMRRFLAGYQGLEANQYFDSLAPALGFLLVAMALNAWVIARGISGGIERLARWGMPLLYGLGILLVVRVLTLGTPDPRFPDRSVMSGLAFMWNPDFHALLRAEVWLAAAGQVFFTLSLGFGMIHTYASFLREDDDVALNGLATCSLNEFSEVVLGGTIAVPVAVAFFGVAEAVEMARGGAYDLGFVTMPLVFQRLPAGRVLGTLWFTLLFIAGFTSSVALFLPAFRFLREELGLAPRPALGALVGTMLVGCLPAALFLGQGYVDELDWWVGTVLLVVFGLFEALVFAWDFGLERGWAELQRGAHIRVPAVYRPIMKYVLPAILSAILVAWLAQGAWQRLLLRGADPADVPVLLGTRLFVLTLFGLLVWGIRRRWSR